MRMPGMRTDTTIMRITITAMITTIMVTITMIIMLMTTMPTIMPRMTMGMIITTTSIAIIPTITTATSMLMTTNEPVGAGDLAAREAAALYRLMTWLSPAYPVGGFSYSSGIEWAVEAGDIIDIATLADWLDAMLGDGSGFCDATFLVHAYRVTEAGEETTLNDIAELAAAFVPSRERQLETTSQGRAFIDISRAAWDADGLDAMVAVCRTPLVYPVAVGVVAATAHRAPNATLDDLGSATFRADLASLRHETQYTRLFRS